MKWIKTLSAFYFLAFLLISRSQAQVYENPGQYMDYISKQNQNLTMIYLSYVSAVSHGKSARKVEKRRQEVLNAIDDTRFNIQGMPPWKGDRSYRDSTVSYLKLVNIVFKEDYSKIVDMEEIAEQSYDAMEAYMLAQQKAQEKLHEAIERQNTSQREFAVKNNINLIEEETELSKKSKTASELNKHYDQVYLVFFKANKQEAYLMEAVNNKNINAIEQNKNSLERFAIEGMAKLKEIKPFNNDPSMINACRQALAFYKIEATQMHMMTDFFLKEENFNKVKKNLETKPASKRTQQEIDQFNSAVKDFNDAVNSYNATNKDLNKQRSAALDEWNKTTKKYLDDYMPVQKKVAKE
jgi:hypothetical protein